LLAALRERLGAGPDALPAAVTAGLPAATPVRTGLGLGELTASVAAGRADAAPLLRERIDAFRRAVAEAATDAAAPGGAAPGHDDLAAALAELDRAWTAWRDARRHTSAAAEFERRAARRDREAGRQPAGVDPAEVDVIRDDALRQVWEAAAARERARERWAAVVAHVEAADRFAAAARAGRAAAPAP